MKDPNYSILQGSFFLVHMLIIFFRFCFLSKSKGYTRGVTKPQFSRMLHFLSLNIQPQDLAVSVFGVLLV